ncbi:MAG TPA: glycosyltransferase family 39 protein [Anaerolineales bacterium]|nr:glycosyltransferase family 39 protein [Anaerolineales bacterium]
MKQRKPITRDEWSKIILVLAITIGIYLRFNPTLQAGFAINDGGMFAVMVDDLRANDFALPNFTTYNHLNIPYVYPPLGFYLGALASLIFGWDSTQVVRWVPAFFASLSIPAFYLLALQLLKNQFHAAVSTLFFAFTPRALWWFVMGGGLTRSPGQFFMLLTLAVVIRLYEQKRRSDIILAGVFGGLAVTSHPEAAVHTLVSAVFLWLMLSRKRADFIYSILVGVVVAVVSAPWWASVISNHGIAPLLSGAATGSKFAAVFNLLFFVFTGEPYATVIAVLGLIGIAHRLIRRDYLLPLWMAIPFFIEGRSAAGPAAIPLAMLAALGLVEVLLPAIQPSPAKDADVSSTERNVFIYLILYLIFSTAQFGIQLADAKLYPPDEEAMRWVRENTRDDSRFLVLTGTTSVSCDSVMEWFPAISGRKSLFTVQGTEWTKGAGFNDYVRSTYGVQRCLSNSDVLCLDDAVSRADYDYIYVSKILRVNNCSPLASWQEFPYFVESLKLDSGFEVVYETDGVLISRKK